MKIVRFHTLALVLAGALGAGGAWGQAQPDWDLEKVSLPNGCTIILQSFYPPANILRNEGACKNGLADGDWVYGQKMATDKDRTSFVNIVTVARATNG